MFSELTNFGYKRTGKQAFGFYLAYLFLLMIIGGILAFLLVPADVTSDSEAFAAGAQVGARFVPIAVIILSVLILNAKKSLTEFKSILLVVLAGFLAILGGGLLGLIPVAYLTTTEGVEVEKKVLAKKPVSKTTKKPVKKVATRKTAKRKVSKK